MIDRYQIDFLPVGEQSCSGDAICIRYGDVNGESVHVVDGGFRSTGESVVEHIQRHYGAVNFIQNVVLTHSDGDHAGGLISVLEHFSVGTLWMNRPWLYVNEIIENFHGNWTAMGLREHLRSEFSVLVELESLAVQKGVTIREVFQGATIGPFRVLTPSRQRYIDLLPEMERTPTVIQRAAEALMRFADGAVSLVRESWSGETLSEHPSPTTASNEASVVQYAELAGDRILLTADTGPEGLDHAASYGASIGLQRPTVIQVPHHGSRRNVTPSVLNRWLGDPLPTNSADRRGVAYCSAAADDSKHPKKKVLNAFLRRGYPVWVTKGQTWLHSRNLPRANWVYQEPAAFQDEVED